MSKLPVILAITGASGAPYGVRLLEMLAVHHIPTLLLVSSHGWRLLTERAADVVLKERRTLILVPRETPLSLVHLRNLTLATETGAIVLPAAPGFYHKPQQVRDLVDFVVQRVLDQLGLDINLVKRWEGK